MIKNFFFFSVGIKKICYLEKNFKKLLIFLLFFKMRFQYLLTKCGTKMIVYVCHY